MSQPEINARLAVRKATLSIRVRRLNDTIVVLESRLAALRRQLDSAKGSLQTVTEIAAEDTAPGTASET